MSDEESFQLALDADPSDYFLRLVFADWLEERGDERAAGMRAMGEIRACGCNSICVDGKWQWFPDSDMAWWANFDPSGTLEENSIDLPESWVEAIGLGKWYATKRTNDFPSRRAAEDAAALAWNRLTPDQQSAILASVKVPA